MTVIKEERRMDAPLKTYLEMYKEYIDGYKKYKLERKSYLIATAVKSEYVKK